MRTIRNFLFIMCDQLRADHLSCYGHPHLQTPAVDQLARRGVLFERAFVQSGVCGPSRMSFYTGRYVSSHRATWNRVPLPLDEWLLGDYLDGLDHELVLFGKTHWLPDEQGLARLGTAQAPGQPARQGGFVELARHDGHHAEPDGPYARWLRDRGYDSPDPWSEFAISTVDASGRVHSGWQMRNVHLPARVREEHSETAYTVGQAIEYLRARGSRPWSMHLSLVKPHWPYVAPSPYHAMYGVEQCLEPVRDAGERSDPHPAYAAYMAHPESRNFAREEVWRRVRPAYQGLVRQVDDHLGRLWEELDRLGRWEDTLVVFTSDHGDYLGDHWLGEKELFHDCVQRVPLIVYDPSSRAGATRGTRSQALVEAIDVVPTALEALGAELPEHRIEGRSLLAHTRDGAAAPARDAVFSELDFSFRQARLDLGLGPAQCQAAMVREERWKYVDWQGLPPQLFDLQEDPGELRDLGRAAGYEPVRSRMRERLHAWRQDLKRRTTVSLGEVERKTATHRRAGVHYGLWDES